MYSITRRTLISLAMLAIAGTVHAQSVVGKPAPPFQAKDLNGKTVKLSDFVGKHVVLEWFSTSCPFVRKHYASGNMPATQRAALEKGVVWLSINSDARNPADKEGMAEVRSWAAGYKANPTATILDGDGAIGKAYGARATPHMFVINPQGMLVYAGAIDNRPSANPADVAGATNYVSQALRESLSGAAVSIPRSQPYGCGIKYAGSWRSLL